MTPCPVKPFHALVLVTVLGIRAASAILTQDGRLPDVIYMDQPTGIELNVYQAVYPALGPYLKRLRESQASAVEAGLKERAAAPGVTDGELNLLAQIEWQRGEMAAADAAIARAVALAPNQPLNAFQQAMVNFAHLRRASGILERWKWQGRTRDAYQRTFDLDPRNAYARYYLAYSYMNTPWIGGGDTSKALTLSEGGIALGQVGFYAVRADAHRVRGEIEAANADYDTAIRLKVIKLGGFLDAAREEMQRQHWERARRYLDWSLHCRPDATQVYEAMGDYFLAKNDREQARQWFQAALQHDPRNSSAGKKLAAIS